MGRECGGIWESLGAEGVKSGGLRGKKEKNNQERHFPFLFKKNLRSYC